MARPTVIKNKMYVHVKISAEDYDRIKTRAAEEYFYSVSEFVRVKMLQICDQPRLNSVPPVPSAGRLPLSKPKTSGGGNIFKQS